MADYKMICPPSTAGGRYSDSTLVAEILKSMCNNVYKDAKTITNWLQVRLQLSDYYHLISENCQSWFVRTRDDVIFKAPPVLLSVASLGCSSFTGQNVQSLTQGKFSQWKFLFAHLKTEARVHTGSNYFGSQSCSSVMWLFSRRHHVFWQFNFWNETHLRICRLCIFTMLEKEYI